MFGHLRPTPPPENTTAVFTRTWRCINWDQWLQGVPFPAPLWRTNLYISLRVWGQARGIVTGEELGQGLDDGHAGTGDHQKGWVESLPWGQISPARGQCRAALRGTLVAHGWQILYRFGCHAEAQRGFEITAACNKEPSSPLQLDSAHCRSGVKLHRETRQLWSEPDHLTSNMSHVRKPSEGASHRAWYLCSWGGRNGRWPFFV